MVGTHFLPSLSSTRFLAVSDPDGKRVGSGGATLNALGTTVTVVRICLRGPVPFCTIALCVLSGAVLPILVVVEERCHPQRPRYDGNCCKNMHARSGAIMCKHPSYDSLLCASGTVLYCQN